MSKVFTSIGNTDSSIFYANKSIIQPGVVAYPEGMLQAAIQLSNLYERIGKTDSTIKYLKLSNSLKDSLFSRKKTREAQKFAFNEKLHQQELISRR